MYENNYPNNYNNTSTEQGSVNHNTYQYGTGGSYGSSGSSFQGGSTYQQSSNTGKAAKKKNGSGFGKKIAIGICCGLCFGIFAGVGFQAVTTAMDFLKGKIGFTQIKEADAEAGASSRQAEGAIAEIIDDAIATEDNIETTGSQIAQTTVTDVSSVVKDVMPAVVSVNNRYIERMTFFGQEYSQEAGGSGSGIIVGQNDTELLLVTNYHVVASAEELTVQFVDEKQVQAQIKGTDADKDLAVIAVALDDISDETKKVY